MNDIALYLIATPIGSPDDLSPRAARLLREAKLVIGEEFRPLTTLLKSLGREGMILSRFNVPTAQTVVGANLAVSTNTANAGNPLYAALVDNSGNILATSNTITSMPAMYGTWQSFTFTPGVAITGSTDYHIGLVQTANTALGYFPMGTYPVSSVPANLYSTRTLTASALTPLTTNLGIMGIEANFAGACITGINNVEKVEGNVSVYPNPASTYVNVKLQSQSGDATVAVYNAIGQWLLNRL